MSEREIELCGELQGESDDVLFVFDGERTIQIEKRHAVSVTMTNACDCKIKIPFWLAKLEGVV